MLSSLENPLALLCIRILSILKTELACESQCFLDLWNMQAETVEGQTGGIEGPRSQIKTDIPVPKPNTWGI